MMRKLTLFVIHPSDLLTDYEPYGDGLIVNEWLRLLAARGHRIHVAAPRTALRVAFPANVTIHEIPVAPGPRYLERWRYGRAVRRLFLRIRAHEHIDVAHQFNPVVPGLSLALLGVPVPIVLGTFFPRWPQVRTHSPRIRALRLAKSALSFAGQCFATKLLLSTAAAATCLPLAGLMRAKLVVMPHAVDDVTFAPSPVPPPVDAPPRILFLANIMRRKGVFTLVEAFALVRSELPGAELVFAGGGFDERQLRDYVDTLPAGLRAQIRFTGNVARADVPGILADCSVYCLPSDGEPYGMSALEAMACGKAMVVTNTGGLPHLVPDDGALKVPPNAPGALADALLRVLRSPELQQRMGRSNRMIVEQVHAPERALERLEELYYSLVPSAPQPVRRRHDAGIPVSRG